MASPIAAGIALGAAGAYGVYRLSRYAREQEGSIVGAAGTDA